MSAFNSDATPVEGHGCNTCKAIFSSIDKVKAHYRGEWHIFNSKRRAHDMAPLTKADFKAVTAAHNAPQVSKQPAMSHMEKMIDSKPWSGLGGTGSVNMATKANYSDKAGTMGGSTVSGTGGVGSRRLQRTEDNRKVAAAELAAEKGEEEATEFTWGGITAASVEELRAGAQQMGIGKERIESIVLLAAERQAVEEAKARARRAAFLEREGAVTSSSAGNLKATDDDSMDGGEGGDQFEMAEHAESEREPVLGANVSIFDDTEFETTAECVAYMEKQFGFFLPDRDSICDLDGLLEYLGDKVKLGGFCLYCQKQMTPGRPCQMHMLDKSHCKIAYEEDVDMDEFDDFYDFTEENASLPHDEDGNPIEAVATLSATGEMILPGGRLVGHRQYRHYYKQRFAPVDQRPAVLAMQREQLLKLGIQVGADYTEDSIVAMPDVQVMTLLMRHQKVRRKELAYQQRAEMKDMMREKRKDQAIKSSKLRSSEQRTQIIRDYHGMLQ